MRSEAGFDQYFEDFLGCIRSESSYEEDLAVALLWRETISKFACLHGISLGKGPFARDWVGF